MLRNIAWVAVAAAACCVLALVLMCFGLAQENWYLLAGAGVAAGVGAALSLLSLREDR